MNTYARLLLHCSDQPGLVARLTGLLYAKGLNILSLDQHASEDEGGHFFLRLEFQCLADQGEELGLKKALDTLCSEMGAHHWHLRFGAPKRRTAILASRTTHAPMELLWRWKAGELDTDIAMVISNHEVIRDDVERLGIPFHHIPVEKGAKADAERQMLELLDGQVDLVVLARYMQILSPEFVSRFPNRIINIHHSFLPAFVGANPYGRAHERGVKIIGATAHYVTSNLDQGPIIEQGVARCSHRDRVDDLRRRGRDIEREVLARAVAWHLEDRILVHGNKTVVFA